MNTILQNTFFSAIPGAIDPFELRKQYQIKLLHSLKIYLSSISQSFTINLDSLANKLVDLNVHHRFSPLIYTIYIQLKEAYEKKDKEEIFDCIQLLINESSENFYAYLLEYGTTLSEMWERPFLREIRKGTPLDENGTPYGDKPVLFPLVHWDKADFPPSDFHQSIHLLKILDLPLFNEVTAYASRIKFYMSLNLHSVTSPRYFGAIYMRLPFLTENHELFFLETLVHEVSHLHLFTIMDQCPIITNCDHERFASPLRPDKRPMVNIFHAVFVLARIVRILRKYCDSKKDNVDAQALLKKKKREFEEGINILSAHAKFSPKGQELYETLEICAFESCLW